MEWADFRGIQETSPAPFSDADERLLENEVRIKFNFCDFGFLLVVSVRKEVHKTD